MGNWDKRKLKLKEEVKTEEKVGERVGARTYQEMVELALIKQLDSKTLNEKEVRILVDCLTIDDGKAKELKAVVDVGKPVLLAYGKEHDQHDLYGDVAHAKIGDKTDFSLPPSKVIKILEKEGKLRLLDDVLAVRVTEFRKYLGSDLYEQKAEKTDSPFATISLRKK